MGKHLRQKLRMSLCLSAFLFQLPGTFIAPQQVAVCKLFSRLWSMMNTFDTDATGETTNKSSFLTLRPLLFLSFNNFSTSTTILQLGPIWPFLRETRARWNNLLSRTGELFSVAGVEIRREQIHSILCITNASHTLFRLLSISRSNF